MAGKKQVSKKKTNAADGGLTELAAKKKHVRDLAKAGRWREIKKQYGEKMVAKAKAYAEKNKAKHTPQSLAQEILAKNGYTSPPPVKKKDSKQRRMETPDVVAPVVIEVSPGALTEAQKQQIEEKRREALERRNRKLTMLPAPAKPASKPVTLIGQHDQHGRKPQAVQKGFVHQQQHCERAQQAERFPISEDELAAAAADIAKWEVEQKQQQAISDELAAAAGVVQWEEDQANRGGFEKDLHTFSDDMAAAAEIVNWELGRQNELDGDSKASVSAVVTDDDDAEYDRPHFQLLATSPTMPMPNLSNSAAPTGTSSPTNQPSCQEPKQQLPSNASHKRKNEPAKEYLEKQQATNPQRVAPSPSRAHARAQQNPQRVADQNRQAVDAFIKKHTLADKFDLSVLDFVEMMLA